MPIQLQGNRIKTSTIVHEDNGKWEVESKEGKNLGESDTKKDAVQRLREVEYFKHHPEKSDGGGKKSSSSSIRYRRLLSIDKAHLDEDHREFEHLKQIYKQDEDLDKEANNIVNNMESEDAKEYENLGSTPPQPEVQRLRAQDS